MALLFVASSGGSADFWFWFWLCFLIFVIIISIVLYVSSRQRTTTTIQAASFTPPDPVMTNTTTKDLDVDWGGLEGPDFIVSGQTASESMYVEYRDFSASSCAIQEGLITAAGRRKLLRFTTRIINIGNMDMALGDPTDNPAFHFSPCHGHHHFEGFTEYILLNESKTVALTSGHKQAYCLRDNVRVYNSINSILTNTSATYDCANQGISVGWADDYGANLDGQWVDITNIPPGNYVLRITVNTPVVLGEEINTTNNVADILFTLPMEKRRSGKLLVSLMRLGAGGKKAKETKISPSLEKHVHKQLVNRVASGMKRMGGASVNLMYCQDLLCSLGIKNQRDFRAYARTNHPDKIGNVENPAFTEVSSCVSEQQFCTTPTDLINVDVKGLEATIDKMEDVSDKEKKEMKQEIREAKKELDHTINQYHIDDVLKTFANIILSIFETIWNKTYELLQSLAADPDSTVSTEIVSASAAKNKKNSWWTSIKDGIFKVGRVLIKVATAIAKGLAVLGKMGLSVGKWIISNPTASRMALTLAVHFRNRLCRRMANYMRDQVPLGSDVFAFNLDTAGEAAKAGVLGGVREFTKSSLFDTAFDTVSSTLGNYGAALLSSIPWVGTVFAVAATSATRLFVDAAKEATREAIVLFTYYKDVTQSFELLVNLVDLSSCWREYQQELVDSQIRLQEMEKRQKEKDEWQTVGLGQEKIFDKAFPVRIGGFYKRKFYTVTLAIQPMISLKKGEIKIILKTVFWGMAPNIVNIHKNRVVLNLAPTTEQIHRYGSGSNAIQGVIVSSAELWRETLPLAILHIYDPQQEIQSKRYTVSLTMKRYRYGRYIGPYSPEKLSKNAEKMILGLFNDYDMNAVIVSQEKDRIWVRVTPTLEQIRDSGSAETAIQHVVQSATDGWLDGSLKIDNHSDDELDVTIVTIKKHWICSGKRGRKGGKKDVSTHITGGDGKSEACKTLIARGSKMFKHPIRSKHDLEELVEHNAVFDDELTAKQLRILGKNWTDRATACFQQRSKQGGQTKAKTWKVFLALKRLSEDPEEKDPRKAHTRARYAPKELSKKERGTIESAFYGMNPIILVHDRDQVTVLVTPTKEQMGKLSSEDTIREAIDYGPDSWMEGDIELEDGSGDELDLVILDIKPHSTTRNGGDDKVETYDIHDNYGRPFRVAVDRSNKTVAIHEQADSQENEPVYEEYVHVPKKKKGGVKTTDAKAKSAGCGCKSNTYKEQPFLTFQYINIWIGFGSIYPYELKEDGGKWTEGNTILVEPTEGQSPGKEPTRLIVIQGTIFEMRLTDINEVIERYESPIGNNDVPYPSIWTNQYVYLIAEGVKAPRSYVDRKMPREKTRESCGRYMKKSGNGAEERCEQVLLDVYSEVYYNDELAAENKTQWTKYDTTVIHDRDLNGTLLGDYISAVSSSTKKGGQGKQTGRKKSGGKPEHLGIKAWFQYAKENNLLLTVKQLEDIKKKKAPWDNSIHVQKVHALDQGLLFDAREQKTMKIYEPIKFFNVYEQWMNIGDCKSEPYGNPNAKEMAWKCPMWSIIDNVPDNLNKKDYRIQFDQNNKGEWGYLAWDDGDDAFTRYMTREQIKQMPKIQMDGTWPDR